MNSAVTLQQGGACGIGSGGGGGDWEGLLKWQ